MLNTTNTSCSLLTCLVLGKEIWFIGILYSAKGINLKWKKNSSYAFCKANHVFTSYCILKSFFWFWVSKSCHGIILTCITCCNLQAYPRPSKPILHHSTIINVLSFTQLFVFLGLLLLQHSSVIAEDLQSEVPT